MASVNITASPLPALPRAAALNGRPDRVICDNGSITATLNQPKADGSQDALLYIVIVLSFYALAMIVLMVKYVRRENQEAQLRYYYTEFIKRDKFHSAAYQNRHEVEAMRRKLETMETLETIYQPPENQLPQPVTSEV